MIFSSPAFLWLLLLIPLHWIYLRRRKEQVILHPWLHMYAKPKSLFTHMRIRRFLEYFLIFSSVLLISRPLIGEQQSSLSKEGIDIMLSIDISLSMMAEDLKPNRMEAAKTHLQSFVGNIEQDRIGIVAFSGKAVTLSPLTFDYDIINYYLSILSPFNLEQQYVGISGTNISDALLLSSDRLNNTERTRVIVLLTDGDANSGIAPVPVAESIAKQGIKLYVVGIGQDAGILIPLYNDAGEKIYIKNPDGTPVYAQFNEKSLQAIAQAGGGKYFRVTDNNSLERVLSTINELEKTDLSIQTVIKYKELFPLLLLFHIGLFIVYFFHLNTRRL